MTKTFIQTYAVHFHNVLGPSYKGLFFPHPICAQNSTMTKKKIFVNLLEGPFTWVKHLCQV